MNGRNSNIENALDILNSAQKEAVTSSAQHLLVLAGAGSGKTRVLVHRIAWLVSCGVSPFSILAVTFTNKAAAEMRNRLQKILEVNLSAMWVGTFHGIAHRLLRMHWQEANLPEHFQIMDAEDQLKVIRRVMKSMDLDEEKWEPKPVQYYINGNKDKAKRPSDLEGSDYRGRTMITIYQAYEDACAKNGLVDFAELLLRAYDLLRNHPHILLHYQQKFRCLLVDEFQDTNTIQYAWLKLLAGGSTRLTAVGDDDQSIYGWRGAEVKNIRDFGEDFLGAQIVRLEQNYRSTATILQAANAVIQKNTGRLGKNLWTSGDLGDSITVYAAFSETDEARYICECIQSDVTAGRQWANFAVLYRSNAQSRALEESLLRAGIPYRIFGGLRFFERAEIKNVLAYLRLLLLKDDDASFERVINLPSRGVGEKSLDVLRSYSRENGISLWASAKTLIENKQLTGRASAAISQFILLLEEMTAAIKGLPLSQQIALVLDLSGLVAFYEKEKGERSQNRIENIKELLSATHDFEQGLQPGEADHSLSSFLSHASLDSGYQEKQQDAVQLMTLHSSKGLEFPVVFLVGLEEGLFPHQMSLSEADGLEEERRLCYVGITRAQEKLVLSHAECRQLYGEEKMRRPSRFLKEIPSELLKHTRKAVTIVQPVEHSIRRAQQAPLEDSALFRNGQRVVHRTFGSGTVLNCEGVGDHSRIYVSFDKAGSKWLVAQYAKLEPAEA